MHNKLYSSVNILCDCEMILIHGYVFIGKQLANLKVSQIFVELCYLLLQNSSAFKYLFYLKFLVESDICRRFCGNNFLNYVSSCQKYQRAVLVTNSLNIMNNSCFC